MERVHFGNPGAYRKIILGCIFNKWEVVVWSGLIWHLCWALVNAVMNLRVIQNAGNFLTNCKPVSFSRRTVLYGVSE